MIKKTGFVLIELVVALAVIGGLIGLVVTNLPGIQRGAILTSVVDTLIADIKSQQTKAMSSTLEGGVKPLGFGVRYESNRYILFHGLTFNAMDPSNVPIPLPSRVEFTVSLPDDSIVFASRSGEIVGYDAQESSVTIRQLDSGESHSLQFNHYGIITSVD